MFKNTKEEKALSIELHRTRRWKRQLISADADGQMFLRSDHTRSPGRVVELQLPSSNCRKQSSTLIVPANTRKRNPPSAKMASQPMTSSMQPTDVYGGGKSSPQPPSDPFLTFPQMRYLRLYSILATPAYAPVLLEKTLQKRSSIRITVSLTGNFCSATMRSTALSLASRFEILWRRTAQ